MGSFFSLDTLSSYVLLPALPLALVPFVVFYWTVFSRPASRRWTHVELACMIWFVGTVALMYWHPAVQYYSRTKSFFFELLAFAFVINLVAAPLGWSVAALGRALTEKSSIVTSKE